MNLEWSKPTNLIFGLFLAFIPMAGCKKDSTQEAPKKVVLPTIVEDGGYWANNFAAEGEKRVCRVDGTTPCDDHGEQDLEDRKAEAGFEGMLSAALQSDPTCSGLTLSNFGGLNDSDGRKIRAADPDSQSKNASLTNAEDHGYWVLITYFVPGEEKQSWTMQILPWHRNFVSGKGDAKSMAQTICSVAKGVGGTVID